MNFRILCTSIAFAILSFLPIAAAVGGEKSVELTVHGGACDRVNTPVCVVLDVPAEAQSVAVVDGQGNAIAAQLTALGLLNQSSGEADATKRELHMVLPKLGKDDTLKLKATFSKKPAAKGFAWSDKPDEYYQLSYDGRPVLRYMCLPFDDSTAARRHDTYKVFHHLFDPEGKTIVTKGPGGQFTHHRGLFYGFNRISYGDARADTWHCGGDAHLTHEGVVSSEAGPVLGRHLLRIDWHGKGKKVFAQELREMTVYAVPGGQLVEFASRLDSTVGKVTLDGDPQHAGFQFRASQKVAEGDQKLSYYLRTDGKGKPGETRNWPGDKRMVNLPWNALSFVIDGERYTAVYLDKPTNPKEARYSERTYGRFGSYFKTEIDTDKPLVLNYRVWLQSGEMTVDEAAALSCEFVNQVEVDLP